MERERAIEILRKEYDPRSCDKTLRKALETLIPELRESEDERIRTFLLDYAIEMIAGLESDISLSIYDGIKGYDPDAEAELTQWQKARAYLEKQSTEHKTYDGKALSRSYDLGYRKGVADAEKEMYEESGYTPDESRAYDHGYENGYNDGKDEAKQKPAEWSEEDEKMRNLIVAIFEVNHPNGFFKANELGTTDMRGVHTEEIISWLKSFRPYWKPCEEQIHAIIEALKYLPNNKDEWRILNTLVDVFKKLM